ncbi:hypothetical protein, no similarity [Maudiozyma saulgeensis]|uniref:Uncharacterized protein n=1 Tax=Maudiozyma saulgeensis TaxID=1789683 RepID=A0A1X7QW46_9SACH|nr:hypothetical protein, no similarity [Kazachstania saulgeensis]
MHSLQHNRLNDFFETNYSKELEHNQQQKINKLRETVEVLEMDLLYILSKDARSNFINGTISKKNIQINKKEYYTKLNNVQKGILNQAKSSTKLSNRTVNNRLSRTNESSFEGKENCQMEEPLYDTVMRYPQFKEVLNGYQKFDIKRYNIVSAKKNNETLLTLSGNSFDGNVKEIFDQGTQYSSGNQSESKNVVSKNLFQTKLEESSIVLFNTVGKEFDKTIRPQQYITPGDITCSKKYHRVRFWLNDYQAKPSRIKLLSHSERT